MDDILITVENACAEYVRQTVISQSLAVSSSYIYKFLGSQEIEPLDTDGEPAPYITVHAESADRAIPNQRIDWWKVKTNIVVVQPMSTGAESTRGQIANTIFNAFLDDNAPIYLTNATSSFSCADLYDESSNHVINGSDWVQMLTFVLLASPTGST